MPQSLSPRRKVIWLPRPGGTPWHIVGSRTIWFQVLSWLFAIYALYLIKEVVSQPTTRTQVARCFTTLITTNILVLSR
jgi:hypothetical protein